jgi:hypothetical protein
MASNFPTSLDSFSNPASESLLNHPSLDHSTAHSNINDAIEAIQAKIGITDSNVSDSIEYRLSQIETLSGVTVVRKTEAEWTLQDPVLLESQIGLETDTLKFKFGSGADWSATAYSNITPTDLGNSLGDYIPISDRGSVNGVASLDSNGKIPESEMPSTIATKTYADTAATNAAAAILDSAPSALNTLNELAAALGDDANYATTITTALGLKQDKVSGVSDTEIGYLDGVTSAIQTQINAKADKLISFNQQSSSYTLALSDKDKMIEMSGGGTLTVPAESSVSFPNGSVIEVSQTGSSQVTIAADSGVTINYTPGLKLRTQWSSATLLKRGTDLWLLSGDLSA